MPGQIYFSQMPTATVGNPTDRFPILVPDSPTEKNKTITVHSLFGNLSVPVKSSKPITCSEEPVSLTTSSGITIQNRYAFLDITTPSAATINLLDGQPGQEVLIVARTLTSDCFIVPVNKIGFNSIRFTSVGASCSLIFIGGKWVITSQYGTTIS